MKSAEPYHRTLGLDAAPLRERTGAGISIAVLDSGVNPHNPHVTPPVSRVALMPGGFTGQDVLDRHGHGTAVVAAIQEKAPSASLHVIQIFHDTLSTDTQTLTRALDRAGEQGGRLINLSLGTRSPSSEEALRAAVARSRARGSIIVSPFEHRGSRWWPGSVGGVAGVLLDWDCPRNELRLMRGPGGAPLFRASGYPRPVPGVPASRNLRGISFAVANVTGILARLLEAEPGLRSVDTVARTIEKIEKST